ISDGAVVFLVGDCEFGSVLVLQQLDQWHWFYVLRQKSDTCVMIQPSVSYRPQPDYRIRMR
ncbi:MAG: hypothetical protein MUP90_08345, partial [Gammaproteobacteria bacterium]|nr:hypothetical protein [Gammaproteobacteria bacterium]